MEWRKREETCSLVHWPATLVTVTKTTIDLETTLSLYLPGVILVDHKTERYNICLNVQTKLTKV